MLPSALIMIEAGRQEPSMVFLHSHLTKICLSGEGFEPPISQRE